MAKNPVEGELSKRELALIESRRRTLKLKREYRDQVKAKQAEEKANKWASRRKESMEKAYEDMTKISRYGNSLNRQSRRKFAKRMNVFKSKDGWQHFNSNYAKKFGIRKPFIKPLDGVLSPVFNGDHIDSNIVQALKAAKVTPKKEETK